MWMARSIFQTCWGKFIPQDETHLPHNCRLRNLPKVKAHHIALRYIFDQRRSMHESVVLSQWQGSGSNTSHRTKTYHARGGILTCLTISWPDTTRPFQRVMDEKDLTNQSPEDAGIAAYYLMLWCFLFQWSSLWHGRTNKKTQPNLYLIYLTSSLPTYSQKMVACAPMRRIHFGCSKQLPWHDDTKLFVATEACRKWN